MARKPKIAPLVDTPFITAKNLGPTITAVKVESRRLLTLDSDSQVWKGTTLKLPAETWKGSIVRLRPPVDISDDRLEQLKELLASKGVARIKLEQRRGVILPNESLQKAKATKSSAREVVLKLVEESNSSDRPSLLEICERVMSEENL